MKTKFIVSLIGLSFIWFSAVSQEKTEVELCTLKTAKGDVSAFKVKIKQAQVDKVAKTWQNVLKKNTKSKIKASANEFSIENTILDKISDQPMNVFSALAQQPDGVELIAAFELEGDFINEFSTRKPVVDAAKNFLLEFVSGQRTVAVQDELNKEEKTLKNLEADLDRLMKQNTSLQKRVSENEQRISNIEEEIKQETALRERKNEEIIAKRNQISANKNDPELLKTQKSELKKIENEKKNTLKRIETMHNKIISLKADIQKANRDIAMNNEQQEIKNNEIRAQMTKVSEVENKLRNIK